MWLGVRRVKQSFYGITALVISAKTMCNRKSYDWTVEQCQLNILKVLLEKLATIRIKDIEECDAPSPEAGLVLIPFTL